MTRKWLLEGYVGKGGSLLRIPVDRFPLIVGREASCSFPLIKAEISRRHAVFEEVAGELILRDLDSTNGTSINHQPLKGEAVVRHGDVIHFASYELRLLDEGDAHDGFDENATQIVYQPRQNRLPTGLRQLQLLLNEKRVGFEYQPIVLPDGHLYAYEILGRGRYEGLPENPAALFYIAESVPGKAAELSVLLRDLGVEQACQAAPQQRLFVNTHPSELLNLDSLLIKLQQLVARCPQAKLVLEIHEDAVTDIKGMKAFARELSAMNIALAYDDFGAGQARLLELVDVPVEYVKFDMGLIRGLDQASPSKRQMVSALAKMTRSLGIQNLAEGVETAAEHALCVDMGFDLIQGYYFSRPRLQMDYKNP